ncbi:MAG: hypothetical protein ACHQ51_01200 [Elusimicrobiota bacterium]
MMGGDTKLGRRLFNCLLAIAGVSLSSRADAAAASPLLVDEACFAVAESTQDWLPREGGKGCKTSPHGTEPDDIFSFEEGANLERGQTFSNFGSTLAVVEVADDILVLVDGKKVAEFTDPHGVREPIQAAFFHDRSWVLEHDGTVVVDGHDIAKENGYQAVFFYRFLGDRPFFLFVDAAGKFGMSFDGKVLPFHYDAIPYGLCCSNGVFNPRRSPSAAVFFGLRGKTWYSVTARARLPTPEETTQKVEGIVSSLESARNWFTVEVNGEGWATTLSSHTMMMRSGQKPIPARFDLLHLGQRVSTIRASNGELLCVIFLDPVADGTEKAMTSVLAEVVSYSGSSAELTVLTWGSVRQSYSFIITPDTKIWRYKGLPIKVPVETLVPGAPVTVEYEVEGSSLVARTIGGR